MSLFPHYAAEFSNASGTLVKAGDVIRLFDGPFADATVLGFNKENGDAKVSRPYVYASGVGTTGPTPLLGAETFVLSAKDLKTILAERPIVDHDRLTAATSWKAEMAKWPCTREAAAQLEPTAT